MDNDKKWSELFPQMPPETVKHYMDEGRRHLNKVAGEVCVWGVIVVIFSVSLTVVFWSFSSVGERWLGIALIALGIRMFWIGFREST